MRILVRFWVRIAGHRRIATKLAALLVITGLGIALMPGRSAAEQPPQSVYARDGAYMGGRGVYGISDFAVEEPPGNIRVEDGWGFGFNAGYRFLEVFAGELDMEVMDPGFRVEGQRLHNFGMTLYGKAYPFALLPPAGNWLDRLQPYAKVGLGFQYFYANDVFAFGRVAPSGTGFVARFGVGTEFYLSRQLALTFDAVYSVTTGPISGLNSWSLGVVGLMWRFSPN